MGEASKMHHFNTERFLVLLEQRGIGSLSHFSELSGVHRNTLRAYLKKSRSPFSRALLEMATELNVDPLELITEESSDKKRTSLLQEALAPVIPSHAALVLFGSRARETHHVNSDWDLGLIGGVRPFSGFDYLRIKSQIDDALEDFPNSYDIVNLDQAPTSFLKEIGSEVRLIYGDSGTFSFLQGVIHGLSQARAAE
jgi:transcriptional regulator with XRE-family HTH domain